MRWNYVNERYFKLVFAGKNNYIELYCDGGLWFFSYRGGKIFSQSIQLNSNTANNAKKEAITYLKELLVAEATFMKKVNSIVNGGKTNVTVE